MDDKPIYQQLDEEFQCEHAATEIRYKVDSLGRRFYVRQCFACGAQAGSAIPYADVPNRNGMPAFDDGLRDSWWKRRQVRQHELAAEWEAARAEQQQQQNADWWARYSEYLQSPAWAARRTEVLMRDDCQCQAGYPSCLIRATEVHHLSYKHAFDEPLFDLVSVCHPCHERLHNGNGK